MTRARRAFIQGAVLASSVAALAAVGLIAARDDRAHVTRQESDDANARLRSLSAEGALLVELRAAAPATFVRVHADGLAQEATKQGEAASRGAADDPAGAQAARDEAPNVAARLASIPDAAR